MNMFDRFNAAVKNIGRKKYYHGSVRNITDGFLQPRKRSRQISARGCRQSKVFL